MAAQAAKDTSLSLWQEKQEALTIAEAKKTGGS